MPPECAICKRHAYPAYAHKRICPYYRKQTAMEKLGFKLWEASLLGTGVSTYYFNQALKELEAIYSGILGSEADE
ncbi:MAG TPA: hypothetical protein VGO47_08950 [Chlamydiales bacterium]|nr:hypothetical protein [Chlamydiales bacterium]